MRLGNGQESGRVGVWGLWMFRTPVPKKLMVAQKGAVGRSGFRVLLGRTKQIAQDVWLLKFL
jgi:hypothetical protein